MKTKFDRSALCHVWANQLQDSGSETGGSRMFFEDNTIFSYGKHFPIARHVTNNKGGKAVLFTRDTYSNTTARHIGEARSAASHLNLIYVPFVEAYASVNDKNCTYHGRLFGSWVKQIGKLLLQLGASRKPENYILAIDRVISEAKTYCDFFGVKPSKELKKAMNDKDLQASGKELAEKAKKASEKAKKDHLKVVSGLVKAFKEFKPYGKDAVQIVSHVSDAYNPNKAWLRYNKETKRVETSKGVEIPVKIAEGFYKWLLETIKAGGCNGCQKEILNYKVTAVSPKEFKVGCHTIAIEEAQSIATSLQW